MLTDQQVWEAALPFIAYLVSYLIQQLHWSAKRNTAAAGATIVGAAIITAFLQHRFTANVLSDVLLVASVSAGLQTGALAPLSEWLKSVGSKQDTHPPD